MSTDEVDNDKGEPLLDRSSAPPTKKSMMQIQPANAVSFDFEETSQCSSADIVDVANKQDIMKSLEHSNTLIQEYQECIMQLDERLHIAEAKNQKLSQVLHQMEGFFQEMFPDKYKEIEKSLTQDSVIDCSIPRNILLNGIASGSSHEAVTERQPVNQPIPDASFAPEREAGVFRNANIGPWDRFIDDGSVSSAVSSLSK